MKNPTNFSYQRVPCNDNLEAHIVFRCSDEYSIYAPVVIYSILENNKNKYCYIYIFTDLISDVRWNKILKVSKLFNCCEIIQVIPEAGDLDKLKKQSRSYHGWWMIHISVFYQKYLPMVHRIFSFGIDSFCVGDLSLISLSLDDDNHFLGSCNRHQIDKSWYSLNPLWIGFDGSYINLKKMRQDGISPQQLIDYSIERLGYIHDEVAYNGLCNRQFIESNYIYIYSGSYLPNKKINPMTVIVDYYCTLKPWLVSFKGYQVFDIYIEYYNKVNKVFSLEYDLPASHWNAIYRLYKKGFLYLDIISFSFPLVGIHIYSLGSLFRAFFRLLK